MIKATKVLALKSYMNSKSSFTYSDIASTALLGTAFGKLKRYDSDKVYNRGDKCVYFSSEGEMLIIACIEDEVTGEFNPDKWEEFNVLDEMDYLYQDMILMSWSKPHLRRNKVWIQVKNDSIQKVKDEVGDIDGLLIFNNLIISARQPKMNPSIVWGQITSVSK